VPLELRCLVLGLSYRLGLCSPFCISRGLILNGQDVRGIGLLHRLLISPFQVLLSMGTCLCLGMIRLLRSRLVLVRLEFVKGNSFVLLVLLRLGLLLLPILPFCRGSILCRFFHLCCLGIFFGRNCLDIELLGFCL